MSTELLEYYSHRTALLEQACRWVRVWDCYRDLVRLNDMPAYDMKCAEAKIVKAKRRLYRLLGD
jgi:hypothetical protein